MSLVSFSIFFFLPGKLMSVSDICLPSSVNSRANKLILFRNNSFSLLLVKYLFHCLKAYSLLHCLLFLYVLETFHNIYLYLLCRLPFIPYLWCSKIITFWIFSISPPVLNIVGLGATKCTYTKFSKLNNLKS